VRVLACLAEGLGIRATARVFEVAPHTVLQWLVEAAEQLRAFSAYFLCDLHLRQLQLDELYTVLRERKAGEISDDEAIKRLECSPYWVWTAMDPKRSSRAQARAALGQEFPHPLFRYMEWGPSSAIAHVSCAPSKIPDGGFSPVRLQARVSCDQPDPARRPSRDEVPGPPAPSWPIV